MCRYSYVKSLFLRISSTAFEDPLWLGWGGISGTAEIPQEGVTRETQVFEDPHAPRVEQRAGLRKGPPAVLDLKRQRSRELWGWSMTRTRHRGGRQAGPEARGRAKSSGTRRKTEAGVKLMSVSGERGGGLCRKMREEKCEEHWRRGEGRLEVRWLMSTSTGRRPHSQNLSLLFMTSTKEPNGN